MDTILRQCDFLQCRRWYMASTRLLKQGYGRYCSPWCGWGAQHRRQALTCRQCGNGMIRRRSKHGKPVPQFCHRKCYLDHVRGIKNLDNWRAIPFPDVGQEVDPFITWLDQHTTYAPDGFVAKGELIARYNACSNEAGRSPRTATALGLALRHARPGVRNGWSRVDGKVCKVYVGIVWRVAVPGNRQNRSAAEA